MSRHLSPAPRAFLVVLLAAAAPLACSDPEKAPNDTHEHDGTHEHAGHGDVETPEAPPPPDEREGLLGLDEELRAAAVAQDVCPVSGEPLGSMGTPYVKQVDGMTVFLCCRSCERRFDSDPGKYLAKIGEDR